MDPQPDRCKWRATGRRTTAGEFIAGDYSINYAHMVFSTNVCWYLDNTFCVMFHSLLAAGMDATLILQVVVFFVNALGFIYVRRNARRAILRAILRRPAHPLRCSRSSCASTAARGTLACTTSTIAHVNATHPRPELDVVSVFVLSKTYHLCMSEAVSTLAVTFERLRVY